MIEQNDNLGKSAVMHVVDLLSGSLIKVENVSIVVLFILMTAVCFYQVICRYILKISAPWTEEMGRYTMIYMVMIGSGWAIQADHHIKIDAIYSVVKNVIAVKILNLFLSLLVLVFCAFLAYASVLLIPQTMSSNLMSVGMNIPTYIPMLAMPIGGILMVIHSACVCIRRFSELLHGKEEEV